MARSKQDDDVLWSLTKRIANIEKVLSEQKTTPIEIHVNTQDLEMLVAKLHLLITQLTKHVNPTREEVTLLKRSNRELGRELLTVHKLLQQYQEPK